ncbi:unnamed protein product [Symbiodinium necroappetens]|uniref:Uncharacterized protein n=1 Tax=Symbiodinium necroappetens TaxID=1628268 RepID=A0A813CA82_9DINO|nr:unnamed protein product [Symbiodinium sp. CCMP2456]CAE7939180.1 unnamed protein product [Symbiodinium necroappetens]
MHGGWHSGPPRMRKRLFVQIDSGGIEGQQRFCGSRRIPLAQPGEFPVEVRLTTAQEEEAILEDVETVKVHEISSVKKDMGLDSGPTSCPSVMMDLAGDLPGEDPAEDGSTDETTMPMDQLDATWCTWQSGA